MAKDGGAGWWGPSPSSSLLLGFKRFEARGLKLRRLLSEDELPPSEDERERLWEIAG